MYTQPSDAIVAGSSDPASAASNDAGLPGDVVYATPEKKQGAAVKPAAGKVTPRGTSFSRPDGTVDIYGMVKKSPKKTPKASANAPPTAADGDEIYATVAEGGVVAETPAIPDRGAGEETLVQPTLVVQVPTGQEMCVAFFTWRLFYFLLFLLFFLLFG